MRAGRDRGPGEREAVLLLAGLVLLTFLPALLSPLFPTLAVRGHDLGLTFGPKVEFGVQHFPRIPGWQPTIYAGHPYAGNPQAMAFYPGAMLLHLLGWSLPLVSWLIALHALLAALFCRALGLRLGAGRGGALVGAIAWALGGQAMGRVFAGHLSWTFALPWIPLLFLGLEGTVRRGSTADGARAGLALGLLAVSGAPQAAVYAGLGGLLFALWLAAGGACSPRRLLPALAALLGPALLIALPQARVTLPFLGEVARAGRFAWEHATTGAMTPGGAAALLFPPGLDTPMRHGGYNWEQAAYVGVPALLCALRGLLLRPWGLRLFFLGLLAFAFLFALGEATPLFGLAYRLPLLGAFRTPGRMMVLAAFALALLAALGYPREEREKEGRRRLAWSLAFLLPGATLLAFLPGTPAAGGLGERLLGLGLLGGFGLALAAPLPWPRRPLVIATVGILAGNLFLLAGRPALFPPERIHPTPPALEKAIHSLPAGAAACRWRVDHEDTGRLGLYPALNRRGLHSTRGNYDPGVARSYRQFLDVLDRLREADPRRARHLWDLLAVRYRFARAGEVDGERERSRPVAPDLVLVERLRVPDRFRWIGKGKSLPDLEACLALHLDPARRKPDPRTTVTLLAAEEPEPIAGGAEGRVELAGFTPDRIELAIACAGPGYAVLSEQHLPGWEAELDGRPAPILRADGLFRAVRVAAGGRHRLVLRCRHRSTPWWTLGGVTLGLWLARRRRRPLTART